MKFNLEKNNHKYSAVYIRNYFKKNKNKKYQIINFFLKNIKKKNKIFKAIKYFDEKKILEQYSIQKNFKEPLYGVPIGIKDIFNTFEYPNSMGSNIYKNYTPGNDARVVFNIRSNGGIIFGKTFSSEFAVHEPTPTLNPYNKKLSPGTSSAGSAVAVATGMLPITIGSQTAGSIIRPASYCGVYGFKPSYGTIARTGVLKTTDTLDTIGFFSNYVQDLKLIFNSVRQKGKNYPIMNDNFFTKQEKFSDIKLNIARIIGPKSKNINRALYESYDNLIKKIKVRYKNINIFDYKLPKVFNDCHFYHNILYSKSLSYYLKNEYRHHPKKISKSLKKLILKGEKISNSDYDKAENFQSEIIMLLEKKFKNIDFFMDLSTFTTAPKFGSNGVEDHNLIWTMGHIPTISLPLFKSINNLPYGLLICSKKYHDLKLLNFAKFLSKINLK